MVDRVGGGITVGATTADMVTGMGVVVVAMATVVRTNPVLSPRSDQSASVIAIVATLFVVSRNSIVQYFCTVFLDRYVAILRGMDDKVVVAVVVIVIIAVLAVVEHAVSTFLLRIEALSNLTKLCHL